QAPQARCSVDVTHCESRDVLGVELRGETVESRRGGVRGASRVDGQEPELAGICREQGAALQRRRVSAGREAAESGVAAGENDFAIAIVEDHRSGSDAIAKLAVSH